MSKRITVKRSANATAIESNGTLVWDFEAYKLRAHDGVTSGGRAFSMAPTGFGYVFPTPAPVGGGNPQAQGSVSGYTSGGFAPPFSTVIDKFPFSSDADATDVGDLSIEKYLIAGQSSSAHGYISGGSSPTGVTDTIEKFSFTSDGDATDVGELTSAKRYVTGHSSENSGYTSGGYTTPPASTGNQNVIEKFPFNSDTNSADVGDLTSVKRQTAGQSSSTHGYVSGGGPTVIDTIEKFPFSSDADATDIGELTEPVFDAVGQSSSTHGYRSGGSNPGIPNITTIDKFSFSSDSSATDVGDITNAGVSAGSQSSTTDGYKTGGSAPGGVKLDTIDKFPFSSDTNATDIANLTQARSEGAGQQV